MTIDDITLALHMTDDTSRAFYDLVTHQITWLSEYTMTPDEYEAAANELDEHGFKRLPGQRDINEYGMMKAFAEEHDSRELPNAIEGRGAFRRFKMAVRQMGLEQEWYQYREEQYRRIAPDWCSKCGIELEDDEQ